MEFAGTIVVLVAALALCRRYLGGYLVSVFDGRARYLTWIEQPFYRALRIDPHREQSWQRYAASMILFSGVAIAVTYAIVRLQGVLPLNPQRLGAVRPDTAWNTAVAFVTNTDWQSYAGETTMSYLSQMGGLTVQNFLSAAVGMAAAIALVRGFARRAATTIGNFWADLIRGTLYVLLPISFAAAVLFISQGAVQTLGRPVSVHNTLSGVDQVLLRGPIASQEAIKQLGTNGGGFFTANGASPFENPTGLTNLLSILLILCLPVALTYVFGRMVGSTRQGVVILAVMAVLFAAWLTIAAVAEMHGSPAMSAAGVDQTHVGNVEGKESRFGVLPSALYDVTSTQTSTGSLNSAADSYTPMGGFALLTGMMLGEVSPGGVGSGLYTMLLFALITVFVGGLMVGRTPEYLGKKIQAREVKLAALGVLVMPVTVLVLTAVATGIGAGRSGVTSAGPHGFAEILYAYTSQANNNGSAFGGLHANTPFYNVTGSVAMLLGRFAVIIPVLALAGGLAAKKPVASGVGTFRTDRPMFAALLTGVVVVVGALTFVPAVALGPVVEQLSHGGFY
jgi:K+-transporting ATPase ATPase A chain